MKSLGPNGIFAGVAVSIAMAALMIASVIFSGSARAAEGDGESPFTLGKMDLAGDFKKLETQWEPFLKLLDDPEAFGLRRGKVSAWTVGQHASHIATSTNHIAREIDTLLAHPDLDADKKPIEIIHQVLAGGVIPRGRGKAPEPYRPVAKPKADEVKTELKKARDHWRKHEANAAKIHETPSRYAHFAFGPLTSEQWVRLTAVHNAHHMKIIDDILKDAGMSR